MKLYLVHFGYYLPNMLYEQHGCVHVAAADLAGAKAAFKQAPPVASKCHIDGIEEVRVAGYHVALRTLAIGEAQPPQERQGWSAS